jgi:hypothetical protein
MQHSAAAHDGSENVRRKWQRLNRNNRPSWKEFRRHETELTSIGTDINDCIHVQPVQGLLVFRCRKHTSSECGAIAWHRGGAESLSDPSDLSCQSPFDNCGSFRQETTHPASCMFEAIS